MMHCMTVFLLFDDPVHGDPSYMPPLVEDGGRCPPSPRLESCVGGGRLRGRASHAHRPSCLQAPCIHATAVEEDPCHRRSRRRIHMARQHARHRRLISTRRSLPSIIYITKIIDVKNLQLSSARCSVGNLGATTPSSSCNGADGLLTHISWKLSAAQYMRQQ
jgi:hypothetical protein